MTNTPFSIRMITVDCRDPARLAAFWSAATGRPVVADYGAFVMVGSTPMLGFNRSPTQPPVRTEFTSTVAAEPIGQILSPTFVIWAHKNLKPTPSPDSSGRSWPTRREMSSA